MRVVWDKIYSFHLYTMHQLKRLYHWVMHWAHTKYGTPALFLIAFIESSFFVIPPDVLLIALCASRPEKSFWYALVCTIGSVLGGMFGYLIGYTLYEGIGNAIITTLGYQEEFTLVGNLFLDNAFWAILGAAFTPIPYKVFTIAAGVWSIPFSTFLVASILGRAGRFFLVAGLLYFAGAKIKVFIDRYFNILTLIMFVLLIAGFVAMRFLG